MPVASHELQPVRPGGHTRYVSKGASGQDWRCRWHGYTLTRASTKPSRCGERMNASSRDTLRRTAQSLRATMKLIATRSSPVGMPENGSRIASRFHPSLLSNLHSLTISNPAFVINSIWRLRHARLIRYGRRPRMSDHMAGFIFQ